MSQAEVSLFCSLAIACRAHRIYAAFCPCSRRLALDTPFQRAFPPFPASFPMFLFTSPPIVLTCTTYEPSRSLGSRDCAVAARAIFRLQLGGVVALRVLRFADVAVRSAGPAPGFRGYTCHLQTERATIAPKPARKPAKLPKSPLFS